MHFLHLDTYDSKLVVYVSFGIELIALCTVKRRLLLLQNVLLVVLTSRSETERNRMTLDLSCTRDIKLAQTGLVAGFKSCFEKTGARGLILEKNHCCKFVCPLFKALVSWNLVSTSLIEGPGCNYQYLNLAMIKHIETFMDHNNNIYRADTCTTVHQRPDLPYCNASFTVQ